MKVFLQLKFRNLHLGNIYYFLEYIRNLCLTEDEQ